MTESPWRIFHEPQPVQIGEDLSRRLFLEFVMKGERRWPQELQLADDLYDRYLNGLPRQQACQTFLDLFTQVDNIHRPLERANKPRSVHVLNTVQAHLVEDFCLDHAKSTPETYIQGLREQTQVLKENPSFRVNWYYPKVMNLAMRLGMWQHTARWFKSMRSKLDRVVQSTDIDEVKTSSEELWPKVKEGRGYGIRNCFFPSSLFLDDNQAFFMIDEALGAEDNRFLRTIQRDLVGIMGVGLRPRVYEKVEPYINKYQVSSDGKRKVQGYIIGVSGVYQLFPISQAGELRTSPIVHTPLKRAFEREGMSEIYEMFRLFTYLRLYDLTHRADLVDNLPSVEEVEREAIKGSRRLGGLVKGPVKQIDFRRLLVPRVKPLVPEPQLKAQLTEEDGEKVRRFVDQYKVKWFTRRLPQGYHCSDQAKEYAKAHKVTLLEGETIVREHWRGTDLVTGLGERPTKTTFKKNTKSI